MVRALTVEGRFHSVHSKRLVHPECRQCRQPIAEVHTARTRSSSHGISSLSLASPGPTIQCRLHIVRIVESKIFCKETQKAILNLLLCRVSLEVAIESGIDEARMSPATAQSHLPDWRFHPSTHFPHVQLFSSFILVFCLFAHNYDSPKKSDEKKANANGQK